MAEIIAVKDYKYTKIRAKSQAGNIWAKDIMTT